MIQKKLRSIFAFFIFTLIILSCETTAPVRPPDDIEENTIQQLSAGITEEIRSLTETGILPSMLRAIELIRSRDLTGVDFGRLMMGVNTVLIRFVYHDSVARLPAVDLPQTHNYSRIIREAERGNYVQPAANSTDFFEHILPFLAINDQTSPDLFSRVFSDLEKAAELRPLSVFPHYFRGLLFERAGQYVSAETAFNLAYEISNECYPALTGIARVRRLAGNLTDAIAIYSDLITRYPDSLDIKKQLAACYFENRDWARAGPAIEEILLTEPRNGEFLLMRAFILLEQGMFSQANTVLDSYASINSNNRDYLYMRARVQAEGSRNRDSALNYLRSILRNNPNDEEALIYAANLLMESQRPADQAEARELLGRLQQMSDSSIYVLSLSLRDAIQRENWQQAQGFLNRILAQRRTVQDLIDGYTIERNLGNNARALVYARELYESNTANNEYAAIYVSSLIDNNSRTEASRLIENRLSANLTSTLRAQFFYLRSRLQTNEEAALSDLRSSLFEDPRNLDALISMFEIYHRRRDERRAVYYLRQALAIAPDNPLLRRYEIEYAPLLRN